MTALTLSLGSKAGVRPQDLVGAIANEADLPSKQISGIRVDEYTSRVEVPTEAVQKVIEAMHATKVRGRKVRVELEGAPRAAPLAGSNPRRLRGSPPAARPASRVSPGTPQSPARDHGRRRRRGCPR